MGAKTAAVKLGIRANSARANSGEVRHIDNPYTHLAASIILQAYDDLRNLKGEEVGKIEQSTVDRWEIITFFRSRWCGFLLSCQDAITQEQAEAAAWAIFE